jgi:ATP-dependent protease ClpP protease subunit
MRETEGFRPQLFILHYSSFIIHYWVYRPDKPKFERNPYMNDTEKHSPATKNEEANREAEQLLDNIDRSASVAVKSGEETVYCLSVIGQIEGHYVLPEGQKATKYEQLIPLLVSVEENREFDGLLVILNTMGGDVEAGLALAELIASMKKPTVTLVLGGSHSIGVPLAVAGKKSFIVPSATMTIHPVRISGTVIGAPQTYRYFHDMQERILTFVAAHSRADKEALRALMMKPDEIANDIGSILDGEEAVRLGLIDEVGGLDRALGCLKGMVRDGMQNAKCKMQN